tara:strand:+ start:325 stop:612 length:288 start_codon:yes stop_codon:yes gene_type:complete
MKKLTSKKVREYFNWRTDKELRHCPDCISAACNDMYVKFSNEFTTPKLKAEDFMKLLFFNDPIEGLFTHSYGFHTATGRAIIESLKIKYYKYESE